jgi:hypothetical protein
MSALAAVFLLAGCTSAAVSPLPSPPKVDKVPTATTLADFSTVSIPSVDGTTTTVKPAGFKGGRAIIKGRALIGGTGAGGATVRIERYNGDAIAGSVDVTAGPDGGYVADGLVGGRFRVRAFRTPDATMAAAQIFFLGGSDTKTLDLTMQTYSGGLNLSSSISPNPPILGDIATLTIAVTSRGVDNSGVARSIGQAGASVQIISSGGRGVVSTNPQVTGANGRASFTIQCNSLERQGLSAIVEGGTPVPLSAATCELPPTTTTILEEEDEEDDDELVDRGILRSTTTAVQRTTTTTRR